MQRYRICPIEMPKGWGELSAGLRSLKYSDEAMRGIKIRDASHCLVSGTYYEMHAYNERINHPITGVEITTQNVFLYTEFSVYRENSVLVLINPNRYPNSLFKYLSINANDFLTIRDYNFDIQKFCHFACMNLKNFKIKKITYHPFNFIANSTVSISVSSLDDAYEAANSLGIKIPNNIQKISFECQYQNTRLSGNISKSGAVGIYNSTNAGFAFFEEVLTAKYFLSKS